MPKKIVLRKVTGKKLKSPKMTIDNLISSSNDTAMVYGDNGPLRTLPDAQYSAGNTINSDLRRKSDS